MYKGAAVPTPVDLFPPRGPLLGRLQSSALNGRYRAEHGQFPAEVSALGVASDGWVYSVQPSGYVLSKKLGWDPTLQYRFELGRERWVFEPGDGSPEREITL